MADTIVKWFGDKVEKDIVSALAGGVSMSTKAIYDDWQRTIDVDTGASKESMEIVQAKKDGDEIFSMVVVKTSWSVFNELDSKAGRRAMMKNETDSLKNFDGTLK